MLKYMEVNEISKQQLIKSLRSRSLKADESVTKSVADIIEKVKNEGDKAYMNLQKDLTL